MAMFFSFLLPFLPPPPLQVPLFCAEVALLRGNAVLARSVTRLEPGSPPWRARSSAKSSPKVASGCAHLWRMRERSTCLQKNSKERKKQWYSVIDRSYKMTPVHMRKPQTS
ncbi:hypothetical protein TNCT_391791 [Trichonephila clavata]|uniref:Secreted protein n=1 Tax=Trichonephila clavata TaxID=2740835 RepID=A0A8X6GMI6_TRICU|nr:hypothetical protein TNCT_391791 [Trichonephila clavata]